MFPDERGTTTACEHTWFDTVTTFREHLQQSGRKETRTLLHATQPRSGSGVGRMDGGDAGVSINKHPPQSGMNKCNSPFYPPEADGDLPEQRCAACTLTATRAQYQYMHPFRCRWRDVCIQRPRGN
ncbi:unnamed protein product [Pleuronectes platessa]|uniref:Uncharacterized protein n=1 Tax=Pleuronectes platessa TaxID=8262 RepID=A0A9N7U5D6_PLEPL|nr:unnamed protein product [Pleuronectes platessa]